MNVLITVLFFVLLSFSSVAQKETFLERLIKKCDLDDGSGCVNLGILYSNGYGVEEDKFKAFELYKKACELNNGDGCVNLGYIYNKGKGVKKTNLKHLSFIKKPVS
jgi:TPR repeat protein